MGMAVAEAKRTPKPRYKNTVVCEGCHAEFDPSLHWMSGFTTGTTGDFHPMFEIGKNKCPICRKPAKNG